MSADLIGRSGLRPMPLGGTRRRREIDQAVALTIAGSDSSGGAGVQADLRTFETLGVHGTSAITAVTAQNARAVASVHDVPPEEVAAQIDAVLEESGADAAKTGMLASAATVRAVADRIRRWDLGERLVVDPVLRATSGAPLLRAGGLEVLVRELFPLAALVTPNVPEAEAITAHPIRTVSDARAAAREILALGPRAVLVKGGHLEGDATDVLVTAEREVDFSVPRVATAAGHGTGCTLSAAIAAGLALGDDLEAAVGTAKRYVTASLEAATPVRRGWRLGVDGVPTARRDLRASLRLYLIADTGLVPTAALPRVVAAAVDGGVTTVQLRGKGLSTLELVDLALALRAICAERGARFLVNDRADVALAARADGVHVGHRGVEDLRPEDARRLLGPDAIVGVSVASAAEARAAEDAGASYVSAGPMFATMTKRDAGPPAGEALLRAIRAETALPLVAIGGITADRAERLRAAGADGVCVGAAILRAADPREAARAFLVPAERVA